MLDEQQKTLIYHITLDILMSLLLEYVFICSLNTLLTHIMAHWSSTPVLYN